MRNTDAQKGACGTGKSGESGAGSSEKTVNQTEQIKMPTTYIGYDQNHTKK